MPEKNLHMKLIDLKHSRSYYGSMQLGVGFGRYKKHETFVDLVHFYPSFLGPHHLTGRSSLPFRKFATRGDLKSSKEKEALGEAGHRNSIDLMFGGKESVVVVNQSCTKK